MEINFQFPDFENTESIEKFVVKRFQNIKRRLDGRYQKASVTLRGAVTARNSESHAEEFAAEISVHIPRHHKPFFVKKRGPDFRTAITEAVDAMQAILQKDHDKRDRRRHTAQIDIDDILSTAG